MGGCAECGCGWYNPEDGRVADCHRCTGGDGWQETGFNYPDTEKIVARFKQSVAQEQRRQEAVINYDIDEYDERLLRHRPWGIPKK